MAGGNPDTAKNRAAADKIRQFALKIGDRVGDVIKKTAVDIYTEAIMRTPVDKGFAAGNWRVFVAGRGELPPWGEIDRLDPGRSGFQDEIAKIAEFDPSIQAPVSRNAAAVGEPKHRAIYVFNRCKYILPLEYGHSKQNTEGIIGPVVERKRLELSSKLGG